MSFSRRPGARFNRGRISSGSAASWSPALLSTGVEFWLVEDLLALGDGVVAPSWTGRKLGAVLSPFSPDTDVGTLRTSAFLGNGPTQSAGLQLANRAGITTNAGVCGVFNGTNKVWDVWMLCQLDSSVLNVYWSAGNSVATNEYVYCRYRAAGIIKNEVSIRDGALNVNDVVTSYQTLAPQLLRWNRPAGQVATVYADEISQGSTPARVDAGIAVDQFGIGCTCSGPIGGGNTKAASMTINAFGITTGMTAQDIANLSAWAYPRVAIDWKKGLNP